MKALELFTVGYEGRQLDDFLEYLKAHSISHLIDIREIPISRKPGFSKNALKMRLEAEGIEYYHFKQLGSPSEIRNKLKKDRDHKSFFEAYSRYLSSQSSALDQAIELAHKGNSCLLCFERFAKFCHRSTVAYRMAQVSDNNIHIHHL